jgi:lysophospholipase L1-like esterase
MNILVFGDSIVQGAWDKEGGWVERLKKAINNKVVETDFKYYVLISNLGISGDKTTELLIRIEPEIIARQQDDLETIIVIAIGINDSQFVISENSHRTPPKIFAKNIEILISIAKKYASKIFIVGLTPVDESKTVPWDKNKCYKIEYCKKYNGILKSVSEKESIKFINVFDEFIKRDLKSLLVDGLHPNTEGHKLLFETVQRQLKI